MVTSSPISLVLFTVIHSDSSTHSNLALFQQVPFPLTFGFQTKCPDGLSQNQFAVSGCNVVLLIW